MSNAPREVVAAVVAAIVSLQIFLSLRGIEVAAIERYEVESHEVNFGREESLEA